jgi:hypothetical protein
VWDQHRVVGETSGAADLRRLGLRSGVKVGGVFGNWSQRGDPFATAPRALRRAWDELESPFDASAAMSGSSPRPLSLVSALALMAHSFEHHPTSARLQVQQRGVWRRATPRWVLSPSNLWELYGPGASGMDPETTFNALRRGYVKASRWAESSSLNVHEQDKIVISIWSLGTYLVSGGAGDRLATWPVFGKSSAPAASSNKSPLASQLRAELDAELDAPPAALVRPQRPPRAARKVNPILVVGLGAGALVTALATAIVGDAVAARRTRAHESARRAAASRKAAAAAEAVSTAQETEGGSHGLVE